MNNKLKRLPFNIFWTSPIFFTSMLVTFELPLNQSIGLSLLFLWQAIQLETLKDEISENAEKQNKNETSE